MKVKAKIAVGATIIAGVLAYLAYLGASSSWQYYLLVDECVAQAPQFAGKRLRISGRVVAGSLHIAGDRRNVSFSLEGAEHTLPVICRGTLPDNLAEGMDVVVEGALKSDGHLQGEKVITRCASKYAAEETARAGKSERGALPPP
jgi:cytochrome c-type biogenesis protein CcmE